MAETRRCYPHRNVRLERQLLLAAAAAGLSGAFNMPLAGAIFAIEEIARDFESTNGGGVRGSHLSRARGQLP